MMTQRSTLANAPLTSIKGVGSFIAQALANLGIHSVQDLLFHLPLRYEDRSSLTPIGQLRPDSRALINGTISTAAISRGKRSSLVCTVTDDTGSITLRFFHFKQAQTTQLTANSPITCFGDVRRGRRGLEMIHPEYRLAASDAAICQSLHSADRLTAVYPTTQGLTQATWRRLIAQALAYLKRQPLLELIPSSLLSPYSTITEALLLLHQPSSKQASSAIDMTYQRERLILEELTAHQLSLLQLRHHMTAQQSPSLSGNASIQTRFIQQLPFALTKAQMRVLAEINQDMRQTNPMLRLVQGDVGCGKTVVAAIAALQAISSGKQVAMMAPTELLAEQHAVNFHRWLDAFNIPTLLLHGSLKKKQRDEREAIISTGTPAVIVGTHALVQQSVHYPNLGLVIIDEQHRFGVHQRLLLREKGFQQGQFPHQLIMTATPIPRTLAMTLYADLDLSIIDELPPSRTPVTTVTIPDKRRQLVIERVRKACAEGRQIYWVCPLIEDSEILQCQAAEQTAVHLQENLPELTIGLIHGRLKQDQKQTTMQAFKEGRLPILVATTVIEVGVDVPNASIMIIENAERFGLSQLHQLRGRVGRGSAVSYCILLYHAPLSLHAKARLQAIRESQDGFALAKKDLELRGPGELLGTQQTGLPTLRIADLLQDQVLIARAQTLAKTLLQDYPQNVALLIERWLGQKARYGQA